MPMYNMRYYNAIKYFREIIPRSYNFGSPLSCETFADPFTDGIDRGNTDATSQYDIKRPK